MMMQSTMQSERDYHDLFARYVSPLTEHSSELRGCCPFHEDSTPSWTGNRHSGLWKCFGCGAQGNAKQFAERVGERLEMGERKIVATYDYQDEQGNLLYEVVRFSPKAFAQRRPDGNGGWVWNLNGVRGVLYHLPEILSQPVAWLVEGEKDADRLRSLGISATTSPMGAKNWRTEYAQYLAGRKVPILADNDEDGERYALAAARSLLGVAEAIKIVRLPGLPPRGDVSAWLDAGHTKEELIELVKATPVLKLEDLPPKQERLEIQEEEEEGEPEESEDLPPFPEVAWRGTFNTYRETMNGTTEASDIFHFTALWSVAAVQLRRRVCIYYGFPLYPNVYLVPYGPTGDRKTTASRQGLPLLPEAGRVKILRGVGSGEALADWLTQPEGQTVSHFLFLEELAGLLTRSRWEGATLPSFLAEAFDCPPLYEVPFRKNPIKVVEPTFSLLACTTPQWFWRAMREVDIQGGLGSRFLHLTGPQKAPISMPRKPDPHKLEEVQKALAHLKNLPPQEASLSQEALALWEGFYKAWRSTELDPLTKAATERIPAYCLKLAMVYAALEETLPTINEEQLKAAVAVGRYALRCTEALMQEHQAGSRQGACEEAIIRALSKASRGLPAWRIHHGVGGKRFTAEQINRGIMALEKAGVIVPTEKTSRGKPIYALHGSRSR